MDFLDAGDRVLPGRAGHGAGPGPRAEAERDENAAGRLRPAGDLEAVAARPHIVAIAPDQDIVAVATGEGVIAVGAAQRIRPAQQRVRALVTSEDGHPLALPEP